MRNERINTEENIALIKKLRAIMASELNKPLAERDVDLIDECVSYLMELEEKEKLSDELYKESRKRFFEAVDKKFQPKKKVSFKALLVAACLILVLFITTATAVGFNYNRTVSLLNEIRDKLIGMQVGEKTEYKGVDIERAEDPEFYDSVEEFFANEDYAILYPAKLPEGFSFSNAYAENSLHSDFSRSSEYKTVVFSTDYSEIVFNANTNPDAPKDFLILETYTAETINSIECYIFKNDENVQCEFIHNGVTYMIKAREYKHITEIVNNLKEYE